MELLLPHSLELDYMTGCNHGEDVNCVLYNNFVDTPPVKQAVDLSSLHPCNQTAIDILFYIFILHAIRAFLKI